MHSQYLSMKGMISCNDTLDVTHVILHRYEVFGHVCRATEPVMHLILWKHGFWVFLLSAWPPGQIGQGCEAHLLQIWKFSETTSDGWYMNHIFSIKAVVFHVINNVFHYSWMSLTGLFPQKVGVATVMAYITVKHIVGHERETGSVKPRPRPQQRGRGVLKLLQWQWAACFRT